MTEQQLLYAQDHLRILCGLYGIVSPLDVIQAYRLEMGQKLVTDDAKDLYGYWNTYITQEINAYFASGDQQPTKKVIVNVASQEYFKSVALDALDTDIQVITCVFQDDGQVKSVYANRASGLLGRYLITHEIDTIQGIQEFDLEGYVFNPKASNETTLVFDRTAAKQKEVLKEIQAKAKQLKDKQFQSSIIQSSRRYLSTTGMPTQSHNHGAWRG
jgi:uncharacterized protein